MSFRWVIHLGDFDCLMMDCVALLRSLIASKELKASCRKSLRDSWPSSTSVGDTSSFGAAWREIEAFHCP